MSGPPRGEAHYRAKLTEAAVRAIRASHETSYELADRYAVSRSTILFARSGRTWASLPGARRGPAWARPGERHPNAMLTDKDVLALRAGTVSPSDLGRRLGISDAALWKARKGITWKHLPMP